MNWHDYNLEQKQVLDAISEDKVSDFIQVFRNVRANNGKVWVLGNGGSASTASHAVGDFSKTSKGFGGKPLFTIAPSEMVPLQTAYANDVSFEAAFENVILDFACENDVLWILSVSGTSPNLLRAQSAAKVKNMRVLSIVGRKGLELANSSDIGLVIESDDYQIVENVHVILMHWFTKGLGDHV